MKPLLDIQLDEDLNPIYKQARKDIARHVNDAVTNGHPVDISKTLSDLSELKIDKLTQVTMKLSRELATIFRNEETKQSLKDQYRECLTQILNQQISPKVAEEFNNNTVAAIKTLISSQYNRTNIKRNIRQETNAHNNTRIERIQDLTHQLLSQKSSVQSGQTITYSQLQARELLIRKLTNTKGEEQTKKLIKVMEEIANGYQEKQTKGQEATSTEDAHPPVIHVIASKNNDLLTEANQLVVDHINHRRQNNNP